jgi:dimethylglycine dehydrogenase
LLVTGPKSPAIIAAATGQSTASTDFPWLSFQSCQIANCDATAIRVSFAGEAGWEIHCNMADIVAVYDVIMAAGAPHNLGHFGMLALDSMRLEKGYRAWKSDLTSDYTMLESGLDRWVKFDKPEFVGRAALQAEHQAGTQRQLVTLTLDDPAPADDLANDKPDAFGEAVYLSVVQCDGVDAGVVVSAGYGHRVGASIAMAVIDSNKLSASEHITVTVLGRQREAHLVPSHVLYDPQNEKLRG